MAAPSQPLLIKRYASRRLYNTETSDYVTLEDIASFIREGREVQIVDLKSGDDLTRQYLLQIIAEHESRGESVLPVDVLTDLELAKALVAYYTDDEVTAVQLLQENARLVYESYDVTPDTFQKSYQYYLSHLGVMKEIYEEVIERLEELEENN